MKKILSMLLAMALLLSCGALAAGGNANLGRNIQKDYGDHLGSAAVCGDTLYLTGYQNMYAWKLGEADVTPLRYQLSVSGENRYSDLLQIFSDGERLLGLAATHAISEGNYNLEKLEIVELLPGADEISLGASVEADASELTVNYGGGDQMVQVNSACCQGDYLCIQVYDANGNPAVYCMDITTGAGFYVECDFAEMVTSYADGCFLIASCDYASNQLRLYSFDPESESVAEVCEPISLEDSMMGFAYSQESDRLFYISNGYVCAVNDFDFENAQQVAELSMLYSSGQGGMLLPGDYYVFNSWEGAAVRATQPDSLPQTRLVVQDTIYSESVMDAYYSFGNTHGDTAVVISRIYEEDSNIIEAMMNRDPSVDIYIMGASWQAYEALLERGYMLDLSGNEAIRSAVEGMYPAIQRAVIRDGEIAALPVNAYGWCLGVNAEALKALGLEYADVPTNWPDFLDWIVELAEELPEDGSVRIFESYMIQEDVKYSLSNSIMETYQLWLNDVGLERGYDTPELRAMLERLMSIDYSIFGLAEEYEEDENGGVIYVDGSDNIYTLLTTGVGCTIGNFYSRNTPLLLSVSPEYEPQLPMELQVAFVNPFSEHPELAVEFLAEVYANLDVSALYNLSDALNEPLRSSYYEESMQSMRDSIANMEKQLETADAVDVPLLEENIASMKQALEENEKDWWDISPESIEWFRDHDERITVQRYNYLNGDTSGEIWNLSSQFISGAIDLDTYLKGIDRKATMMAMEGN